MTNPDILVVGCGIVGVSCARALAQRGHRVAVVEAGPHSGAASLVAAGMLAPQAEAAAQDPMLELAVRARDFYVELAPALLEETGIDIGLRTDGILQVAFTEEEVTQRRAEVAWQRQSGFTAEWLSPDEVRERAPGISQDVLGAAFAPEDGSVNPLALLEAMTKSAESSGTTVIRGANVEALVHSDDRVDGVRTSDRTLWAGAVVVAAGAWSGRIGALPRPISVEPIRGQIAALDWPPDEPPAIVYGAGGYVVKRGSAAIAGSTMENVGFDASVTADGLNRVRQVAAQVYPALAHCEIRRSWAGLRPQTPDGHPIIGPDPHLSRLWYATGHGRNGILLAGYTGELLARLHSGETIEHDLSCVTPGRFWSW
ncbi:MAG: glycine oxidase ThiO [Gemmatimonadota bacterium]|nr:MAG: glycine oxidase ThiO [Gemmatimonadota bacterium]